MFTYEEMKCRECGRNIAPDVRHMHRTKVVKKYADCYYKCPDCRCAFSNARAEGERKKIYPEKERNVPSEVHEGLSEVLSNALNVKNRDSKLQRFAFETSEDAITWVVFRYLHKTGQLGPALGLDRGDFEAMLFWGVQFPLTSENALRRVLVDLLLETLHEDRWKMSEPDVILVIGDRLAVVEAKYRSSNDRKPRYRHFAKYLEAGRDLFCKPSEEIAAQGFYQMVRNWVIGSLLAKRLDKRFVLINLAQDSCRNSAISFAETLTQSELRRFEFLTWRDVLNRTAKPFEAWFQRYTAERCLVS